MLISLLGYLALIAFAWLCSTSRRNINWRTVAGAVAIQFGFGLLVLYVPPGKVALEWLSELVATVIAYGDEGISFLFGGLSDPSQSLGFVFAFKVLPVIIFFASLISVLYYIRVMPVVVQLIGGGIRKLLGTSRAESLSATANIFDAAAGGASEGLKLALNVGAMLLAFIGLIALVNGILGLLGGFVGFEALSLQILLGWIFAPVAWLLGIPWEQAVLGGSFIGQKLVVNEFVAFIEFGTVRESLSVRSQAIITFALCGFANFSSIAILLGGLGSLVPQRRSEIAQLGLKAVMAGTLANLSSAAIAGMLVR